MPWFLLALAILFEVAGTTSMKLSDGFTRLLPSICVFVFFTLSLIAITFALKKLELSVAYAVWAGTGTALTAAIGIWLFNEPLTALKITALAITIAGIMLLRFASAA